MVTRFSLLFLVAAAGLACAPKNSASIQAYRLCTMPDDCAFSGTCSAQTLENPKLDVSGHEPLLLAVEVHNNLPNNADASRGHLNTNDAHFTSYDIEYSAPRGATAPASVTGQTSGMGRAQQLIPAAGTAVIAFEAIPLDVLGSITGAPSGPDYDEVLAKVTFKGNLDDGSTWELPYEIPVRVCTNCIAAPCDDPTQAPVAACPSLFQYPRGKPTCAAP